MKLSDSTARSGISSEGHLLTMIKLSPASTDQKF